jgi:CBS-domain-containing membrane protein
MGELKVRRMPVLSRDKRLVGIVSLGDLATNAETAEAGEALGDISRPGGEHSQTAH